MGRANRFISREFLKSVLLVGIPISIQNLAQAAIGFVDTAMVAQLGEVTLGAIGLSQQISFFVIVATLGLASGGGVLITRSWGAGQIEAIRSITSMTIFFSTLVTVSIAIISFLYAPELLYFLSSGNVAISEAGSTYLKIIALGFPITALTISLSIQLRAVNKSQYPMYMTLFSLPTAIFFNYVLIYGVLGFPALGATGAAIGTLLTRIIELLLTIFFFGSKRNPIWAGSWRDFTAILHTKHRKYVANAFLKLAVPITAMELIWVAGQSFYKVSFAHLGTESLAAYTVFENVINLFNAGFIGLGNTAAILIGQEIGKSSAANAKILAMNFIKINFIIFIPIGFFLVYLSPTLTALFTLTGAAADYLMVALIVSGALLSLKSFNFLLMTGILRSGGDARFIAVITALAMSLALVTTFWLVFIQSTSFYWILIIILLEENLRNLLAYRRYRSNRWLGRDEKVPATITMT